VPYAYDFAGQPWKTQEVVTRTGKRPSKATPDGIPRNDDLGATSRRLCVECAGLLSGRSPGVGGLVLGTPMFEKATLRLAGGRTLVISRKGEGIYVQKVALDGKPYTSTWLPVEKLHVLAQPNSSSPTAANPTSSTAARPRIVRLPSAKPPAVPRSPNRGAAAQRLFSARFCAASDYSSTFSAISRSTSGMSFSPVRGRMKSEASASQSSLKLGGKRRDPDLPDRRVGSDDELALRLLEQNIQDAILFLDFKACARARCILAREQVLLQGVESSFDQTAELQVIHHGPSVATSEQVGCEFHRRFTASVTFLLRQAFSGFRHIFSGISP